MHPRRGRELGEKWAWVFGILMGLALLKWIIELLLGLQGDGLDSKPVSW